MADEAKVEAPVLERVRLVTGWPVEARWALTSVLLPFVVAVGGSIYGAKVAKSMEEAKAVVEVAQPAPDGWRKCNVKGCGKSMKPLGWWIHGGDVADFYILLTCPNEHVDCRKSGKADARTGMVNEARLRERQINAVLAEQVK